MNYQISNHFLTVTVSSHGAEIQSVRDQNTNREYMWQADPTIWGRHAPVLFPFVGRLKNDQYTYQGKVYHMGQHGFARDLEFELERQEKEALVFLLKDSPETFKNYPFHFEFRVTYRLLNNLVQVKFNVKNLTDHEMIFGVGGHPGFNVPLEDGLKKEDYYFSFLPSTSRIQVPLKAPYVDWPNRSLAATDSLISLSDHLFKNDALIFELSGETKISLRTEKSDYHINVWIPEAPFVGVWSQYPKTGPYVCIEPWWGLADLWQHDGNLETKRGMNHLDAGQDFETRFSMAFHDHAI